MRIVKFVLVFSFSILIFLFISLTFVNFKFPKIESNVSIAVLGKGGEGHVAPDLTDTIMQVFLNTNSNSISVLSLPRDLWISEIRAKLNSSYYWGKKNGGNGFDLSSDSIFKVTGIKPDYYIVVDFSLFKDFIDSLGGIEVNVENTFTDNRYPIAGKENDLCSGDKLYKCRYESISFEKGLQTMDGDTALKYVRSRNAQGDEGTDLAREKRQQIVIESIKNKLLSRAVLLDINTLKNIRDTLFSHLETNIDQKTAITLLRFIYKNKNNISFLNFPEELIVVSQNNPKYDYQYVFITNDGTFAKIQEWIKQRI